MKIGLVQYNPVWEDKSANRKKIDLMIEQSSGEEKILVFPEMSLTGFTMKAEQFSESLNGESFNYFAGIAAKKNIHVLAGIIEKKNNSSFNSLIHINPKGELLVVYRKMHPYSYANEDKHYNRGSETVITDIDGFKVGLSICYDLRFPELYRKYAKDRIHVLIDIANWPDARIEHWRALLKARAIENQCYMIGVNRVGTDLKLKYNGYSSIFDPMGCEVISLAEKENIITADISLQRVEEVRTQLPFLNDIFLI